MPPRQPAAPQLPSTHLGKGGRKVSRLALSMEQSLGASDGNAPSGILIDAACAAGITVLDVGVPEPQMAMDSGFLQAVKTHRENLTLIASTPSVSDVPMRPEDIAAFCEASLKALKTDTLDLLFHQGPQDDVLIEETVGAMKRLVEAGKVQALGLKDKSCSAIRRAHKTHPIAAIRGPYALWQREAETELLATLRGLNMAFFCDGAAKPVFFSPRVQSGAVSFGCLDSARASRPEHNLDQALYQSLRTLMAFEAKALKVTPEHLALCWVLSQGSDIVVSLAPHDVSEIDDALRALSARLDPTVLDRLDQGFPMHLAFNPWPKGPAQHP